MNMKEETDWGDAWVESIDFSATERGFPQELHENERWMGVRPGEKHPFAPWGDRNPPVECSNADCPADRADDDECECDGRYKWSHEGNYTTGETVERLIHEGHLLAHRAYVFSDDDEYLFADLDDVRDDESGEIHPAAVAFLAEAGATWVEVSSSGSGLHAIYRLGQEWPNELKKEPVIKIDDEPWGSNDAPPAIELYPTKHVGVMTGEKVAGAPCEVNQVDASVIESLGRAAGETRRSKRSEIAATPGGDGDDIGSSTGENGGEWTDDVEELFKATNQLDARRVADETIVEEWTDPSGAEYRAFLPIWGNRDDGGTANYCSERYWVDDGHCDGEGGPLVMAAISLGRLHHDDAHPAELNHEDYEKGSEHLRSLGFDVPRYSSISLSSGKHYFRALGEHAPQGTDPYADPVACLYAAVRARERDAVPPQAPAPELALQAIACDVLGAEPDEFDETTMERARDVFESLTEEQVREHWGVGDGGEGDDSDE